ncbi:MAG: STAS domain-containing protein [Pseudomonadota bacterium]|nr:STAS domain-containing protein [Pseudomonadota bacterium]
MGSQDAQDVLRTMTKGLVAESAAPLIVDAAALQSFDSSALAVLLECRRLAQASKRPFVLRDPPPRLKQLAGLYGVASLLGIDSPAPASAAAQTA